LYCFQIIIVDIQFLVFINKYLLKIIKDKNIINIFVLIKLWLKIKQMKSVFTIFKQWPDKKKLTCLNFGTPIINSNGATDYMTYLSIVVQF